MAKLLTVLFLFGLLGIGLLVNRQNVDAQSLRAPAYVAPTVAPLPASWSISYDQSKLTDSKDVYATVESNERTPGGYGIGGGTVDLTIRCRENVTALTLRWPLFLGMDAMAVGWRVDAKPARKLWLATSTNFKAVGAWNGATAIPLIKEMMGGATLVVRLTPYGENPREVTFDISGNAAAINEVRKACKW